MRIGIDESSAFVDPDRSFIQCRERRPSRTGSLNMLAATEVVDMPVWASESTNKFMQNKV